MGLIEKGYPVITKDVLLGTVLEIDDKNKKIYVDFGEDARWISYDDIHETKTAIIRAMTILDKLERIFAQGGPITPEEIEFPTTPTAPRVEKLPPKPPKFPPEVEPPPRPTVEMLKELDSFTTKALQALERLTIKRAEVQEKLDALNAKQKELRNILKELTDEQKARASEIATHLQKSFEGTKELGYFFGKWRDTLLYIVRFLKKTTVEPPPEELLGRLLEIIKEEVPEKYEIISKRLDKIKEEASETLTEVYTYFAEAPIGSIKADLKEAQVIEKIRELLYRFGQWLKTVWRKVVGWLNAINDSIKDISALIDETQEILRGL